MVSKYPGVTTARKRQGSRPRLPRDYQTGGRPRTFPQNDNVPLRGLSRAAMSMLARRLGLKLIPYIGWADTLVDIYEWVNGQVPIVGVRNFAPSSLYWTETRCTIYYPPQRLRSSTAMSCNVGHCNVPSYEPGNVGFDTSSNPIYGLMMEGTSCGVPGAGTFVHRRTTRWARNLGAPVPTPVYRAFEVPAQGPLAWPVVSPVAWPSVEPGRVPVERPLPGEQPEAAPDPEAAPYPWPEAVPYRIPPNAPGIWTFPWPGMPGNPGVFPQPDMVVLEQPTAGTRSRRRRRTNAGSGISTRRAGRSTRRQQPKGKKYRDKPNVRSVGGAVWTGFNFATETIDFAEVLWDGIPEQYQTKGASLAQKYEDIWEHYNKIDLAAAVVAYANNQFEDYLYGQYGKHQGRAMNRIGGATGLSRALRQAGAYEGEAAHAIDPNAQPANLSQLIPHIDFDPNTGVVSLSVPALGSASVNLGNRVF